MAAPGEVALEHMGDKAIVDLEASIVDVPADAEVRINTGIKTDDKSLKCTQILRNVLRKDKMPEYEKWVAQIREMTVNLPGFQDVVKFPMHGDINSLPPNGQLVFIVILTFDCYESLEKATANPDRLRIANAAEGLLDNFEEFRDAVVAGESLAGAEDVPGMSKIPMASLTCPPAPCLKGIPVWKNVLMLISQVFPVLYAHSLAGTIPEIRKHHELDNTAISIAVLLTAIVPYIIYVCMPLYMAIPGVKMWLIKPREVWQSGTWCFCSQVLLCLDQGLAIFKPAPPPPPPAELHEAEAHIDALRSQVSDLTERMSLLAPVEPEHSEKAEAFLQQVRDSSAEIDPKATSVTFSVHVFVKWECVKLYELYIERWAEQCKQFPGHTSMTHIPVSGTEHVVIHGFSDYQTMTSFQQDSATVAFTNKVNKLFEKPGTAQSGTRDDVDNWASLFAPAGGKPPPMPPLYRIMVMVWICLFCTLNVTVGLLDVYLVCQWHVNSLAGLNILQLCFIVPILSYGVTAVFGLIFRGWFVSPVPEGSSSLPWSIPVSGLPNIWCQLAIFVIYWGLLIGRIFWQDGGVPDDDYYTGYLRMMNCADCC